jgi:N-acetylmuramoyl-L-alanine amidase
MKGGAEPALTRLCLPAAEVSCHYLISETGRIFRLVHEEMRAWHAGAGSWRGRDDVNSRSIGIELSNDGAAPFPAAQMDVLEGLLRTLMARWGIRPEGVLGHSDTAPGRKIDPGPRFDWRRLALRGLAVWPEGGREAAPCPDRFRRAAGRAGYATEADDDALLAAIRLRFRPWARGSLAAEDMVAILDVATRFPVDAGRAPA